MTFDARDAIHVYFFRRSSLDKRFMSIDLLRDILC